MRRAAALAVLIAAGVFSAGCGSREDSSRAAEGTLAPEILEQVITPFNRGIALMEQYRPADAVVAFEDVVRIAPDWATGRLNYGIALLNAQSDEAYARAEEEFKTVIAMDPDDPYAHYALGMLLTYFNRLDEARVHFAEVLRIDPDDADANFQMGTLLEESDPQAARGHLEATLRELPHHESATYRLGTLLRRMGDEEASRELLIRFQALKASGAGVFSGMRYGEMGRYADIVRAFEGPVMGESVSALPAYEDVADELGLTPVSGSVAGWPGTGADAADFGPGLGVADVDGDGELDVYLPASGRDLDGALLRGDGARFSLVPRTGIDGRGAIGAFFGDYDGDGDPDLFLTREGPNRLYRNEGDGRFTDVTADAGTAGGAYLSVGASWADADHDGDLDLYVANYRSVDEGADGAGAPNPLWRNNGDGSFTDVAADAGIDGGAAPTTSALYFDFDEDGDADLYLINDGAPNRLFLNDRVGVYTEATALFPELNDGGPGFGALTGDLDGNGKEDVLLLRGPEPPRLFLQTGRGSYTEDPVFGAVVRKIGGAVGAVAGDLDLDGDLDLVLLGAGSAGAFTHRVLTNLGAGRFEATVGLGETRPVPAERGAVAVDLDGDGGLELLVARAGDRPEVWRARVPEGRHWLTVVPGANSEIGSQWPDPTADGLLVEVKAGRHLQVASLTSSSGYLGSPPPRAHFGLGAREKADYVRLSWRDAVLQSEMEVASDQSWRITKLHRKPSSCPMLFAWDGERFAFVTDFLGVGGIGFFVSPGEYSPPDPTEDVRIPPGLIAPKDGRYLLRVAEPLEEVTYLDQLYLVAYDHPSEWEVYPDERFTGSEPFPTAEPLAVAEKIFPVSARTDDGTDVRERILEVDRRFVDVAADPRFVGYASDHWLELDFGTRLSELREDGRLVLYLYGWIEYTYSHVNYAAYQAGITMEPPSIEVPDGRGGWRVAVPEMGFPAGLPRMMTYDITDLPTGDDGRFRIRTNMEIFWDQVFVGVDVADSRLRRQVMQPAVAELRYLGYPREYSPDGSDPTLYDYQRLDGGLAFKNFTGDFTRFGDVRELLADVDDRFVIMAKGEEVALEFDATALRDLPPGWSRTLVLHSDGYTKDMDLYTAYPETVEPLPYHGMENYPPTFASPNEGDLARYRREWNTRRIVGR